MRFLEPKTLCRVMGRWLGALAALATLSLVVVACGGGGSAEPPPPETITLAAEIKVFDADLGGWAYNTGRWYNYVISDGPCDSGIALPASLFSPASCFAWLTSDAGANDDWVTSTGPWWIDPNHMKLPDGTGFGFINVLAFVQLPAAVRAPANLDGSRVSFDARIDSSFSTVAADSRDGTLKGHVYFWFQTAPRAISPCTPDISIAEDCTRQSDFILVGDGSENYEIDSIPANEVRRFSFPISAADATQWKCLSRGGSVKYDCIDFSEAVKTASVAGFVIAPTSPCPTMINAANRLVCDTAAMFQDPASYLNTGTFEVKSFAITKEKRRTTTATRVGLPPTATVTTELPFGWSRPSYGAARNFTVGSGLTFLVDSQLGPLRVGVASSTDAAHLDDTGYQLYISPKGTDDGQLVDNLMVVTKDESGKFDRVQVVGRYNAGDTLGVYFEQDAIVFLRNDEVIMQAPTPCSPSTDCVLYPFQATYGPPLGFPRVFVY